jgi:hypothetical protein
LPNRLDCAQAKLEKYDISSESQKRSTQQRRVRNQQEEAFAKSP